MSETPELILHHVARGSSHGEKTMRMLAYKGLAWRSVTIPPFMPRPFLTPVLTGGYRKTPVLQIGADVWCDTRGIARLLDRLVPDPPLFHDDTPGLSELVASWVEPLWFLNAAALARFQRPGDSGILGDVHPLRFALDRAKLLRRTGRSILSSLFLEPYALDQLRGYTAFLERLLADGRPFLGGPRPGIADFSAYHPLWMLRQPPALEHVRIPPVLLAWMERIASIGPGRSTPMDEREALRIAAESEPATAPREDPDDPAGRRPGMRVRVAPDDYGMDETVGELVASDAHEIAVRRRDPRVGEVVIHFPRLGFQVLPVGRRLALARLRRFGRDTVRLLAAGRPAVPEPEGGKP